MCSGKIPALEARPANARKKMRSFVDSGTGALAERLKEPVRP